MLSYKPNVDLQIEWVIGECTLLLQNYQSKDLDFQAAISNFKNFLATFDLKNFNAEESKSKIDNFISQLNNAKIEIDKKLLNNLTALSNLILYYKPLSELEKCNYATIIKAISESTKDNQIYNNLYTSIQEIDKASVALRSLSNDNKTIFITPTLNQYFFLVAWDFLHKNGNFSDFTDILKIFNQQSTLSWHGQNRTKEEKEELSEAIKQVTQLGTEKKKNQVNQNRDIIIKTDYEKEITEQKKQQQETEEQAKVQLQNQQIVVNPQNQQQQAQQQQNLPQQLNQQQPEVQEADLIALIRNINISANDLHNSNRMQMLGSSYNLLHQGFPQINTDADIVRISSAISEKLSVTAEVSYHTIYKLASLIEYLNRNPNMLDAQGIKITACLTKTLLTIKENKIKDRFCGKDQHSEVKVQSPFLEELLVNNHKFQPNNNPVYTIFHESLSDELDNSGKLQQLASQEINKAQSIQNVKQLEVPIQQSLVAQINKINVMFKPANSNREKISFSNDYIKPKIDNYFQFDKLEAERKAFQNAFAEDIKQNTNKARYDDFNAFSGHKSRLEKFINGVFTALAVFVPIVGWAALGVRFFNTQDISLRVCKTTREKETNNLLDSAERLYIKN